MDAAGNTICLCMIVKNEVGVIRRCLESVRSFIDYWVIVDTGSTDGTQDAIRAHFSDVPGELHERPWVDFAHNRTESLALARPNADYSFVIDADDEIEIDAGAVLQGLTHDVYSIDIVDDGAAYWRKQVVRNALPYRYEGVLHEYLTCEDEKTAGHLQGMRMRRNHDGARRFNPATYPGDIAILERAVKTETRPFLVARYTFHLGQTYAGCGMREKAIEAYLARADLGLWCEEVFLSFYKSALMMEELGYPDEQVIATFERATVASPSRVEALHGAARVCLAKGRNEQGFEIASRGLALAEPRDILFPEPWMYQYGLLDQYAGLAYWSGRYRESVAAYLRCLARADLPQDVRVRLATNARLALERLAPEPEASQPGDEASPSPPLDSMFAVQMIMGAVTADPIARATHKRLRALRPCRAVLVGGSDRETLVRSGMLDASATCSPAELGAALSHFALWTIAEQSPAPTTIAREDAVFVARFEARAARCVALLPAGWDIVLWGCSAGEAITVKSGGDLPTCVVRWVHDPTTVSIDSGGLGKVHSVPLPVRKALGLVCYSVSPGGAAKLLRLCRPMRTPAPAPAGAILDEMVSASLDRIEAFACVPPLVVPA